MKCLISLSGSFILTVIVPVLVSAQTVTVSMGVPTNLNGPYTYQGDADGKSSYLQQGGVGAILEYSLAHSEWAIREGATLRFRNPNDCGVEAPDEGWLITPNSTVRPKLSGDICNIKVVYMMGSVPDVDGDYVFTGPIGGHNAYASDPPVSITWVTTEWLILQGYTTLFTNPNDCGLEAPDEGWLTTPDSSVRPKLSGDVCDVKVVYAEGAVPAGANADYVLNGTALGKNKYTDHMIASDIIWSGAQWEITGPYIGIPAFINAQECGIRPPENDWRPDLGTVAPTLSGDVCAILPVGLSSLKAVIRGPDVELRWGTESEAKNAGFEVHEAVLGSEDGAYMDNPIWRTIGFVEGRGSTLESSKYLFSIQGLDPGRYRYRLAQIDFDGAINYSAELEVQIEVPMEYYMMPAYPNPFNPTTTIRFAVRDPQAVRLEIYDAGGRIRMLVYDNPVDSHQLVSVRINAGALPSGVYLARLAGEHFEASQQIALIK